MYLSKGKIAIIIVSIIVVWLLVMNIGWFMWQNGTYTPYTVKCKETTGSTWLVPKYSATDKSGFTYTVKFPNYLSLVGNLGVASPTEEKGQYVDSIVIWPQTNGTYVYAAMIYDKTEEDEKQMVQYEIMIDENGRAVDKENSEILKPHQENIKRLIARAKEFWPELQK